MDIIQEQDASGTVTANYLRALTIDEPLMRVKGTEIRHYKQDALGSVIALADDTGTVKTVYAYDPFGSVTVSGTEPSSDNPFQYTGRENDATGLIYYRARYYSPMLQRFISEDPIGFSGGDVNLYGYGSRKRGTGWFSGLNQATYAYTDSGCLYLHGSDGIV